jgi:hypothetical protein
VLWIRICQKKKSILCRVQYLFLQFDRRERVGDCHKQFSNVAVVQGKRRDDPALPLISAWCPDECRCISGHRNSTHFRYINSHGWWGEKKKIVVYIYFDGSRTCRSARQGRTLQRSSKFPQRVLESLAFLRRSDLWPAEVTWKNYKTSFGVKKKNIYIYIYTKPPQVNSTLTAVFVFTAQDANYKHVSAMDGSLVDYCCPGEPFNSQTHLLRFFVANKKFGQSAFGVRIV